MTTILTRCPRCSRSLEIPASFDNAVCPGCGMLYEVHRHEGVISLSEMSPEESAIETRLAEIQELIEETSAEIESLRSREQSVPLQIGCAFFGLFMAVIMVIALFILLVKSYFGGWIFYLTVLAVIAVGLARIRRKLTSSTQLEEFRRSRAALEAELTLLEGEHDRMERLRLANSQTESD
jgi:hypothetical protein